MENQILENIKELYISRVVTAVLYFALVVIAALVVVGVIKFKLLDSMWKNAALIVLVSLASAVLCVLQIVEIYPIYKDYKEQSYTVIENAKVIIQDSERVGLDSTNRVLVYDGDTEIELKMQSEYALDTCFDYTGDVAYLKHSNYLIWYDFNEQS